MTLPPEPNYGAQPPYGPPAGPPPGEGPLDPDARMWGMLSHLGALLAGLLGLPILGPLVVLLVKGNDSPFIRRHAVESLNFQITAMLIVLIGGIVGFLGSLATLGLGLFVFIPLAIAYAVFWLVVMVIASARANNGQDYRYPLTLRLVR